LKQELLLRRDVWLYKKRALGPLLLFSLSLVYNCESLLLEKRMQLSVSRKL